MGRGLDRRLGQEGFSSVLREDWPDAQKWENLYCKWRDIEKLPRKCKTREGETVTSQVVGLPDNDDISRLCARTTRLRFCLSDVAIGST